MKIKSLECAAESGFIPAQQTQVAKKLLRSADCYQQRFLKFNEVGIFHSYAEYIHAAILESDSAVSVFVPQPYKLMVGQRRYIPDCYFVKNGERYVAEIKPQGSFNSSLKVPLTDYFKNKGISFKVISNESILEREMLGINWIQIIQTLVSGRFEDTEYQEKEIWDALHARQALLIGDLVDPGHRLGSWLKEIALFRMAYSDRIQLGLDEHPIGYSTEVSLCH